MLKYTSPFMRPCDPGSEEFTYAIFNDTKAANTAGGTFTTGAWRTRDLNTEVYNSIVGALLGSPGDVLLLHMDGADDGTTFTDSTGRNTITTTNAVTKTAQKKFGTASAYFDGSGDYLTITETNDFDFGTGDFTIDFWIRNSTQSSQSIFGLKNDGQSWGAIFNSSTDMLFYRGYDEAFNWPTTSRSNDEWYHMAFVRSGSTLTYFQNGISQGSKTVSGDFNCIGDVVVGYWSPWGSMTGYLDELRISKGIARWTSNFTPLDEPYGPTSLLLHMNGDDSGTTFTDDSGRGHVVTAYGTAQTKTAQKVFGTSSVYVTQTPTNSYLGIPASSDFAFGTGDFTIDFRARFGAMTGNPVLLDLEGYTVGVAITYYNNQLYCHVAGTLRAFSWTPSLDTWYHIVLTRASGVLRAFIDGIQIGSPLADTGNVVCTTNGIRIGFHWGGGGYIGFQGYIDEVRISKGISKWTGGFIVPSNAQGDTSLLLHMDDEGGSVEFVDSSGNNHTVTASGDAALSSTQYKFGGSSAYFDGTGDYLDVPASAYFEMGTGDFTADCWARFDDVTGSRALIDLGGYTSGFELYWGISGNLTAYITNSFIQYSWTPSSNTWYHIAFTRSSGTGRLFVNGTQVKEGTLSGNISGAKAARIGGSILDGNIRMKGYIDEVRIVKGEAKWTSNFTPPTSAYTYTALLLHMDGSDSATTFTDSSESKHSVTAAGNTQTKTAQKKFGTASAYFSGTSGDKLTVPASTDFDFGTGDFTIDFWLRSGTQSTQPIFDVPGGANWGILFHGSTAMSFYDTGSTYIGWTTTARSNDVWYHMAFVRKNGKIRYYQNGVNQGEQALAGNVNRANALSIGYWSTWGSITGYIDELRIVKGVALWNQDFTVPTSEYTVDYSDYGLNQFTLPSGSYLIKASAPASDCNHKCKLYNVSDVADVSGCIGSSEDSLSSGAITGRSIIEGAFTIESTKIFEIQHRGSATVATNGFGVPVNLGVSEVYTQVKVTKIA